MSKEVKQWLLKILNNWRETFTEVEEDDTSLDAILIKLQNDEPLSLEDHEEILFHLWQRSVGEE